MLRGVSLDVSRFRFGIGASRVESKTIAFSWLLWALFLACDSMFGAVTASLSLWFMLFPHCFSAGLLLVLGGGLLVARSSFSAGAPRSKAELLVSRSSARLLWLSGGRFLGVRTEADHFIPICPSRSVRFLARAVSFFVFVFFALPFVRFDAGFRSSI